MLKFAVIPRFRFDGALHPCPIENSGDVSQAIQ